MKQRLYVLAFFAISLALTSCKKDEEPAPLPEVVGKWSLDYGILSGFANSNINGLKIDPFSEIMWGDYFLTSQIHILNNTNKSFVRVVKAEGFAEDVLGAWSYEGTTLTLKYDDTNFGTETYTFRTTNDLNELLSPLEDIRLDSTTAGKIQYVYRK